MKTQKLLPILMAVVIAFSTVFAIPQKKAEAFGLAVPAGIQIGAGVYVGAALVTAGAAGLIGYDENKEAINAHARQVWDGATQISKDSLDLTIKAAVGAGNGMAAFGADYANYMQKHINTMADFIAWRAMPADYKSGTYTLSPHATGTTYSMGSTSGLTVYGTVDGVGGTSIAGLGSSARIEVGSTTISNCGGSRGCATFERTGGSAASIIAAFNNATTIEQVISIWNAFSKGWGLTLQNNDAAYTEAKATAVSQTREAWESMRDAGLVLPVDGVTSHVGDKVVKYNADGDTWTDDAGAVYAPGDVTHTFPKIRYRDEGVPVPGIYTDTPALTGNPAIDKTITDNPAIPKTTTNVNTGVTVANPDYATSEPIEGGGTGEPPPPGSDWTRPPTKKPPNISGLIVTKFPFSLPWDFFGMLGWLEAEPKAPVFKLDASMPNPFGNDLDFDMELKLNFLDDYIGFFRSFILIGFSFFLILATRKLLGGAS